MSKILKVLIVLVTVLAVAAPVVIAEDRLSLSGAMRVRGFSLSEYDFQDNDPITGEKTDETVAFFDQRLRIGGKLSIAEGVSITFRTDITEVQWGKNGGKKADGSSDSGRFGAGRSGSTQQWDRAHIDITKGMLHVRAGQQFNLMGTGIAFDSQGTGFTFDFKTGAPITVIYQRTDDLGSNTSDDSDLYGVQVAHKTDNYGAKVFFAYAHKNDAVDNVSDSNVYLLGVSGNFNAGPVYLTGELDFFGGDANDATSTDAVGLQGYVDASMPISESFTLGGMFLYAASADLLADNEVQITRLGNGFNGWSPETYGPFTTDFASATEAGGNYIFDFTGNNAGLIGFMPYATFKANDDTELTAALMYATPEDDAVNGNNVDDAMSFNLGVDYQLMANTKLASQFNYTAVTAKTGSDPDGAFGLMGRLQVNF